MEILFSSFHENQVNEQTILEIKRIVKEEYESTYPAEMQAEEIRTGECVAKKYDIVIAMEDYPKVPNTIQKMTEFRKKVAVRLFDVIPPRLGYGGNVHTCLFKDIKMPQKDSAQKAAAGLDDESHSVSNASGLQSDSAEYQEIAKQFEADIPKFTFDRLVLSDEVREQLITSIAILENRDKLFEQWGLKSIMSPAVLLNLYGESGTGKTMAAEAIAHRLGKKIIRASYADIESKFHGEGPKRLKGLFLAAKQQDAVLFIDEADSMLSARLGNVTQGSEQAINSMRSQLLISLENHDGIVIFATNLIENYDKAFLTRLVCVEMKRPDAAAREKIWHNHLYPVGDVILKIPLADDVNLKELAVYEFCGRDIRNAVKQACINAVLAGHDIVTQSDLRTACVQISKGLDDLSEAANKNQVKVRKVSAEEKEKLISGMAGKLNH